MLFALSYYKEHFINIYEVLDYNNISLKFRIYLKSTVPIKLFQISESSNYIILVDCNNEIVVYDLVNKKTLYTLQITIDINIITFDEITMNLAISCHDSIIIYSYAQESNSNCKYTQHFDNDTIISSFFFQHNLILVTLSGKIIIIQHSTDDNSFNKNNLYIENFTDKFTYATLAEDKIILLTEDNNVLAYDIHVNNVCGKPIDIYDLAREPNLIKINSDGDIVILSVMDESITIMNSKNLLDTKTIELSTKNKRKCNAFDVIIENELMVAINGTCDIFIINLTKKKMKLAACINKSEDLHPKIIKQINKIIDINEDINIESSNAILLCTDIDHLHNIEHKDSFECQDDESSDSGYLTGHLKLFNFNSYA